MRKSRTTFQVMLSRNFRWIDRPGAVEFAASEFRTARDFFDDPISVPLACSRAIGDTIAVGRFANTVAIDDARWDRFVRDTAKEIARVDQRRKAIKEWSDA